MSIQPNTIGRGCASAFRQPVSPADERESRNLYYAVHYINCVHPRGPRLPRIVYRSSTWDHDVLHRVFCFDLSLTVEYEDVFRDGLGAPPKGSTPDEVYYDLLDHVNSAGREVGTPRAFISTTLSPSLATCRLTNPIGTIIQRYEIYAPGGISIGATLGDRCNYPGQGEVTFVRGVAPQYIHAVQPFVITGYTDQGFAILDRWSPIKAVNRNFDPQSHPSRALDVVNPACDYIDRDGQRQALLYGIYSISHWKGVEVEVEVEAKAVTATAMSLSNDAWYSYGVQENESYINAAFRSSRTNEAYLFMSNDYVLVNYDPGSTEEDRIVNGPLLICQGYASLAGTAFAEHGIDCSFGTHYGDEAYVFSGNLVALIDYAPAKAALDWIISGPMTIASMFPFLEGTVFEHGIDAAFEATAGSEAYLFRGDTCALINYRSNPRAIRIQPIEQGFSSLGGTIFEDGLEAAFASHRRDEAYLFKGKHYAVINFASRSRKDYVVGGVEEILPNWPSLRGILPRKNRGLDAHDHD